MLKKSRERGPKSIGDHQKYISRITKTLYYGKFPTTDGLSLPVTELAAELFSESQKGRSLNRLHCDDAAKISKKACVTPCSLVLAILYLERLKKINPEYLDRSAPSDLFLVSLMVSCKFLYDDGESDEVFVDEWAASAGTTVKQLIQLEKEFLKAISWEIYVNELTFFKKLTEIETILAKKQALSRGFFTYTEIEKLLHTVDLHNFLQNIAVMYVVLMLSYTAALFTLLGSVFIVSQVPGALLPIESPISNDTTIPMYTNLEKPNVRLSSVLKTSIFLASIEGLLTPFCNASKEEDSQQVSWDWWNVPAMRWLSDSSTLIEKIHLPQCDFWYFCRYLEVYVSKDMDLEREDHIQKATKTRIQDQMENSWHVEWTDTIKDPIYPKYLYYLQNIKS